MVSDEEFAKNTFSMAYERAGWRKQMLKTCEECGELVRAIMKGQQDDYNGYTQNILEEMTHVDLCLDMLKYDLSKMQLTAETTALDRYNVIKRERLRKWHEFEALEELKRVRRP